MKGKCEFVFAKGRAVCTKCRRRIRASEEESPLLQRNCTADGWQAPRVVTPPNGPGAELAKILASWKITPKPGCPCKSIAARMNAWGVAGCREHLGELVDEIAADAPRWGFEDGPETRELVRHAIETAIDVAEREIGASDSTETRSEPVG